MDDRVVHRLLRDAEQGKADRQGQRVNRAIGFVDQLAVDQLPGIADRPVHVIFHGLGKAEQMQDRRFRLFDDLAQRLHRLVQAARDRAKIGG